MPAPPNDLPILKCTQVRCWMNWLAKHHATSPGLWLRIAKKDAGLASVSYAQALETALCYGWIDGQRKSHDEQSWLQKFSPRTAQSLWSKVNREKALALIESGQMKAAGLREVERAQQDGRWDAAYAPQSAAAMPDDLAAALDAAPRAKAFFATLDARNRYAVLFRTQTAKKAETRARRIAQFVQMLEQGDKLYP